MNPVCRMYEMKNSISMHAIVKLHAHVVMRSMKSFAGQVYFLDPRKCVDREHNSAIIQLMARFFSLIASPAGLLYLFLLLTQPINGLYDASQVEVPGLYRLLYVLGFIWVIGWWLQQDSRRHGFKWVYDLGLFLYIAWPIILPYYLFKTRGLKALLTILIFLAVYLGAYIIGVIIYFVMGL